MEKKVFAETYMEDSRTGELRDYKFFCFDGEVKFLFIATGRQKYAEPYFDFFDADFNHLELRQGHPNAPVTPSRPVTFDLMKELAAKLSKGIPLSFGFELLYSGNILSLFQQGGYREPVRCAFFCIIVHATM